MIEVETIVREEWARVLAILVGHLRDFELAEDVLQEAFLAALKTWPSQGLPIAPDAWLLQTAKRKAIDHFRRQKNFETKLAEYEILLGLENNDCDDPMDETIPDERLSLMFTCCHPALAKPARVALTLKALGGLSTLEISKVFLVSEKTMAQRIVRAKRKITVAKIPYNVPDTDLFAERFNSVLLVVYFIFNEGYAAVTGKEQVRADLCHEAIRLTRILVKLMPNEPEAQGLLALLLLHDSRKTARSDCSGQLVTLENQDRRLWDHLQIEEGANLLKQSLLQQNVGPYQVQAAISAVHAQSSSFAETDWEEITLLYAKLYELQASPIILLNAGVALSYAKGAEAGLACLEALERGGELENYQPYYAAKADLLRRAGFTDKAIDAYQLALELTQNEAEQKFLTKRIDALINT